MPRVDVDGVSIAYEVVGEGRPWIVTPGGRFSKDYPGVRELAGRAGRPREPGRHLGPPELRRVRAVLPRRVGVRDAGRHARGSAPGARPGPGGDRRRIGRHQGVGSRPAVIATSHVRGRGVVDQRGSVRSPVAGFVLLHAVGAGGVERRHGSGDGASELGGAAGAASTEPRAPPRPGPGRVHRHDGTVDGGLLRMCRGAGSRPPPTPTPVGSTSRRWCSAAGPRIPITPGHVGAARRAPSELGAGGAALARHRMDRSGPGAVAGVRAMAAPCAAAPGVGGPARCKRHFRCARLELVAPTPEESP